MEADRAFQMWRQRLRAVLGQWTASDRDTGALLRGVPLAEAEEWAASRPRDLSSQEREFVAASVALRDQYAVEAEAVRQQELAQAQALANAERQRAEAERGRADVEARARRRLRWLTTGYMLVLALVVAAALFFGLRPLDSRWSKDVPHSLSLAAQAQSALYEGDGDLALALAWEANRAQNAPPEAQLVLAEAAYAPGTRRVLRGHSGPVRGLALRPDGLRALSASADHTLVLWNLETGEPIRRYDGHTGAVNAVDWVPDPYDKGPGYKALSASADGTAILWDLETGATIHRLTGHTGSVLAVDVDAEGLKALSGSSDGSVILWDLETGIEVRRFDGHQAGVRTVAFGPQSASGTGDRRALSGSEDGTVILWDLETGRPLLQKNGQRQTAKPGPSADGSVVEGHHGAVLDVAFGPDGDSALSISQDGTTIVWDLKSGNIVHASRLPGAGLHCADISATGSYALLGTRDGSLALMLNGSGLPILELKGHSGAITATELDPDSRTALSGGGDGAVRQWDLQSGAEVRRLVYTESAVDVTLSPDGQLGLTSLADGDLSLWAYDDGEEIQRLLRDSQTPGAGLQIGLDGASAITSAGNAVSASADGSLSLWDVETGEEIRRTLGQDGPLWDLDLGPDNRFVVSGSDNGSVRMWDLGSGDETSVLVIAGQTARSVAISPDGQAVLIGPGRGARSASDYDLLLIELKTGTELRRFSGHSDAVADLAFSSDGKTVLSGALDGSLILWDAESARAIQRFVGHAGGVLGVAFGPDGRTALSVGDDKVAILWDLRTGGAIRRYVGHAGSVMGLALTPDGNTFLTASTDGTVREWRIDASQAEVQAWIESNRHVPELTCDQRELFGVEPLCTEADTPASDTP
jgi:WD40 repeat protein